MSNISDGEGAKYRSVPVSFSYIGNKTRKAGHFNNRGWRSFTCLHSQFKTVKYLCFIIREY